MIPVQPSIYPSRGPRRGLVPFGGQADQKGHIGIVLDLEVTEHAGASLPYDMQVKTYPNRWKKLAGGGTK